MILLTTIGHLVLIFIVGTIVLWICSLTVNTQNANIKTSAIYNAIMTVLYGVLLVIGVVCVGIGSSVTDWMFVATTILTLIVSFWLLMRMYTISFLATVWLVIAMWAVNAVVGKLIAVIT
jgi:hypothetical protein